MRELRLVITDEADARGGISGFPYGPDVSLFPRHIDHAIMRADIWIHEGEFEGKQHAKIMKNRYEDLCIKLLETYGHDRTT